MKALAYLVFGVIVLVVSILLNQPHGNRSKQIPERQEASKLADEARNGAPIGQNTSDKTRSNEKAINGNPVTTQNEGVFSASNDYSQEKALNPFGDDSEPPFKPFQHRYVSPEEPWPTAEQEIQPFSPVPPSQKTGGWGKPLDGTYPAGFDKSFNNEEEEYKTFSLDRQNTESGFGIFE